MSGTLPGHPLSRTAGAVGGALRFILSIARAA
ncbi:hypothetical protein SAMN05443573_103236 [Celeribacter indicus]|nr:hypothetical protein SAMN05443573_103236 [Celeribacter indicus]